jgi:hypothetical protein
MTSVGVRRGVLRIVVICLASVLMIELALFVFQRRLIYHSVEYLPALLAKQSAAEGFRPWPALTGYRGLLSEPREGPIRGTILHLHGNAGSALDWTDFREFAGPLGYRLILLEYPASARVPAAPANPRWWPTPPVPSRLRARNSVSRSSCSASHWVAVWQPRPLRLLAGMLMAYCSLPHGTTFRMWRRQ